MQKQTQANQKIRFKAFITMGDYNGHVGHGVIPRAVILAMLLSVPTLRGYWRSKINKSHTAQYKVTSHNGSVLVVHLNSVPRGTSIVSAPVPKKLLMLYSIDDCYTSAKNCTVILNNLPRLTLIPSLRPALRSEPQPLKRNCVH